MLPHSPKQSLSLGQNCFEGCRTPAGSQADDAGSQNNQDNSKKKEFWPFRRSAGTGGAGDWQEGSVPGVCPLLLSSVPWERHCPGEVLWSRRQQHRCDLCCVGKCRRCSAQVQSSVCAPAAPESWQGLGCRDLSPSPPAHVHSRLLDAGTDTLVCSCLPCRCPLRARPPELRLLPDTAAAGQVPPPHRAQPVLPQLPPARAAGSAPRPPAPLPEVTALSPRPAPCGRCATGRTGGCATARGAPGSETLLSNGAQTIRGAAGVGHVPCVLCHVPCAMCLVS